MALQQEWEKIARELGDYDLETRGISYVTYEIMVRVKNEFYVGDWVESEKAAKEILRLREELAKLKKELERVESICVRMALELDKANDGN